MKLQVLFQGRNPGLGLGKMEFQQLLPVVVRQEVYRTKKICPPSMLTAYQLEDVRGAPFSNHHAK
jgi:hypothetical protein